MRFGVDDPAQWRATTVAEDTGSDGAQIAFGVIVRLELRSDAADETGVPLRIEPGAAVSGRCRQQGIVLEVLGDGDLPRLAGVDLVGHPGEERPAVGQGDGPRVARMAVDGPDKDGGVEAEAVAAELFQPRQCAIAEERADLASTVVGPGRAPARPGAR